MYRKSWLFRCSMAASLLAGALSVATVTQAQTKSGVVPDAQVEANVLKALAGAPSLANESITTNTVYGTVTLSGSVRDEAAQTLAETLASRADGVKKVVDELTIGSSTAAQPNQENGRTSGSADEQANDQAGTNPNLQSDGTIAPPPSQQEGQPQGQPSYTQQTPSSQQVPYPQQQPPYSQSPPYPPQPAYPQQGGQYPRSGQEVSPSQQGVYPPPPPRPYRRPYGPPSQPPQQAYADQPGGRSVVIPSGALIRMRVNETLSSQHSEPDTVFDGIVINDIIADGTVAIPRGAGVQGKVVNSQSSGVVKGRGELSLELTQVTLGGQTFPVVSDLWTRNGADKTVSTVNSAVALGAVGAIFGGLAAGGEGAAIGAGVGGAAGVGASAASGRGQVYVPAETLLTFHLAQPAAVTTVSGAEMQRLAYGVPAGGQLQRRYPPPPPPYYVGPVYYPRYYRYYPY